MRMQVSMWLAAIGLIAGGFHWGYCQSAKVNSDPWRWLDPKGTCDENWRERMKELLREDKPIVNHLAKQTRDAAFQSYMAHLIRGHIGKGFGRDYGLRAQRFLLEADLALCRSNTERIAALEWHWMVLSALETSERERYEALIGPGAAPYSLVSTRLSVEYELVKAMQK